MNRSLARLHLLAAALAVSLALTAPAFADNHITNLGPVGAARSCIPGVWARRDLPLPPVQYGERNFPVGAHKRKRCGNAAAGARLFSRLGQCLDQRPGRWGRRHNQRIDPFPRAGRYVLALQSNDGVSLSIDGQRILADPGVHTDRFSELVRVDIAKAGWYPSICFISRSAIPRHYNSIGPRKPPARACAWCRGKRSRTRGNRQSAGPKTLSQRERVASASEPGEGTK